MRTRLLLPLLAVALLSPAALAEDAKGGFVTQGPAGLWGDLRLAEQGALKHQGDAGTLTAEAPSLTVRVVTTRSDAPDQATTQEHRFTSASLSTDDGAQAALMLGPQSVLTMAPSGPAPQSLAATSGIPDAMVLASNGGVQLWPFQPVMVDGQLRLTVPAGSSITVRGAEGEQRFRSESHSEDSTQGGVTVPILGTVGAKPSRIEVASLVFVDAEQAHVVVAPNDPPGQAAASPVSGDAKPANGPNAPPEDRSFAGQKHTPSGTFIATNPLAPTLRGSLRLWDASGSVKVASDTKEARASDVLVQGDLTLTFRTSEPTSTDEAGMKQSLVLPGREPSRDGSGDPLIVELGGDVRAVEISGGKDAGASLYQAAAVAGAVGAVGLAALFAPALKYGFSRVAVLPLYARLEKQQLLDNGVRAQILELVRREPGQSPSDLSRQLPCGWSTLVYHLSVLEREGYLSKTREGRRWRFFATGAQDHSQLPLLALQKNPRAARLLAEVRERPGIPQHALSARVALSPSTVHWHMERLIEAGLIRAEHEGRIVRYYPGPALTDLGQPSGAAAG